MVDRADRDESERATREKKTLPNLLKVGPSSRHLELSASVTPSCATRVHRPIDPFPKGDRGATAHRPFARNQRPCKSEIEKSFVFSPLGSSTSTLGLFTHTTRSPLNSIRGLGALVCKSRGFLRVEDLGFFLVVAFLAGTSIGFPRQSKTESSRIFSTFINGERTSRSKEPSSLPARLGNVFTFRVGTSRSFFRVRFDHGSSWNDM